MMLPQAALVLAILLQVPPEDRLEWRVDRFIAGDDSQLPAIRAAGPSAMRLLRSSRPGPKVRPLIREIRLAAASSEDRKLATQLSGLRPAPPEEPRTFLEALVTLMGEEIPWSLELLEFGAIGGRPVTWPKAGSGLDILEDLADQAKVDFAFQRGSVRIAATDRLWPPPPPRTCPLTEDEAHRAESLVSLLGSESPAERDRAMAELRKYGPPLLPLLEAHATGPDLERSSRSKALAADLRTSPPAPPKKISIVTRSLHATTHLGGPELGVTTLEGPTMRFFRRESPSGLIQEITVAADRAVLESRLQGGCIKVTFTGRVLALGQDGIGVRADEVVIDVLEETFACKGHLGVAGK